MSIQNNEISRTPPVSVRRELRQEVNFGCPVPNCGSPYLEYHHFDPPFAESKHHNGSGMIALCTRHHPMADQGKWSKDELHKMKERPYLRENKVTFTDFGWHRRELVVAAGGFHINPSVLFLLDDRPVVWCGRDEAGRLQLNIDIRDQNDKSVIRMDENDWLEINRVDSINDIDILPHGHSLTLQSSALDIIFGIRFEECSFKKLNALALKQGLGHSERSKEFWEDFVGYIQQWPVTVCTLELKLNHPYLIHIKGSASLPNHGIYEGNLSVDPGYVWRVQSNSDGRVYTILW